MSIRRPYVICHMTPSIDGKIVARGWPFITIASAEYERTAATLGADRPAVQPGNAQDIFSV